MNHPDHTILPAETLHDVPFLDLGKINARFQSDFSEAFRRVSASGWYLLGEEVKAFEREYADFIGTRHCVGCGNGLDALSLIFRACLELGLLKEDDEVIVPANTYIASILAISENRLRPVLAEPSPESLQIDSASLEKAISPRTKALLLVHLYGRCAFSEEIGRICRENGIILLEDNAQAHGCRFHGARTGSLGLAAAHSFYPGKNLGALGDAGAVTTDSQPLADCIRSLANYGSSRKYIFSYKGVNSRLDELQAAFLRAKLPRLDADNHRRREVARMYCSSINNPDISLPVFPENPEENVWHIFPVFTDRRDELQTFLAHYGIHTLIHYPVAPHRQECYREWNSLSLPVTESIHARELSIPISPVISDYEVQHVITTLNAFPPHSDGASDKGDY